MKTLDWTAASPGVANLSGSVGQYNQAAQQLFDSLGAVNKTAKEYGDFVTEENTNELIGILNKAESPEEMDAIINNIQSMAESQYFGNVDNKTLNQAIDKRPMELMSRVATKDNYGQLQQEINDRPFMAQATTAYGNNDLEGLAAVYGNVTNPNNQEAIVNMTRTLRSDKASAEKALRDQERQNILDAERIADRAAKLAKEAEGNGSSSNEFVKDTEGGQSNITAGGAGTTNINFDSAGKPMEVKFTGGSVNTPQAVGSFLIDQNVLAKLEVSGTANVGKGIVNNGSKALGWLQILPSTWKDAFTRSPNAQAIAQKYGTTVDVLKNNPVNDNVNQQLYNDVGKMVMDLKLQSMSKIAPEVHINAFTAAVTWQLGEGNISRFWKAYNENPNARMNDIGLDMGKFGSNFTKSQEMSNSNITVREYAKKKLDGLQTDDRGNLLKAGANSAGIPAQVMEDFYAETRLAMQNYAIDALEIGSTKDSSYVAKSPVDKLKASTELNAKRMELEDRGFLGISTAENAVEGLDLFKAELYKQGISLNPETELMLLTAGAAKNDRGMTQERAPTMARFYLDTYADLLRSTNASQVEQMNRVLAGQLIKFTGIKSKYNVNGSLSKYGLLDATVKDLNPNLYKQLSSDGKTGYIEPAALGRIRKVFPDAKQSTSANPFNLTNPANAPKFLNSSRPSNSFIPNGVRRENGN